MSVCTVLMTAILAAAASPKTSYKTGCLRMDEKQAAQFRQEGMDVKLFMGGLRGQTQPPRYELGWAPRPHPFGQGQRGTCVAWAFAYAAKSSLESREHARFPDNPESFFSPSFIYSQRPNKPEEGMYLEDATRILWRRGCLSYADMPYLEANADSPPTVAQQQSAYCYQIADWMFLDTPPVTDVIRAAIASEAAVVFAAAVTTDFMDFKGDGTFKDFNASRVEGYHAMCIVGYDDERKAFRVVNSWGRDWGDQGYVWISYDLFNDTNPRRFFDGAVVLYDGPNLEFKPIVTEESPGRYSWRIMISGSATSLSAVDSVEYLLPTGYQPSMIRRPADAGASRTADQFTLHSADIQPAFSTSPLEVWAQVRLKNCGRAMSPRPVSILCGTARVALASGRGSPVLPPAWAREPSSARPAVTAETQPTAQPARSADNTVRVPDVTGANSGIAALQLMSAGLNAKVRRDPALASRAKAGTVVEQSPAAGQMVPRGSEITLTTP